MTVTATFTAAAGRVRVVVTALPANAAGTNYAVVDRFDTVTLTNGVTVRGGSEVDVPTTVGATGTFTLDDYEFEPNVALTYRVRTYDATNVLLQTQTGTVTAALTQVWLKSPARPFLNRAVTVFEYSDVVTPGRGGVFDILGRRLPVAVTEVRGSKRFDLTLLAETRQELDALELFLSFGDTILLQVPTTSRVPGSMYAYVGQVTRTRGGRHQLERRYLILSLTEVDAPDPEIVGYTITWAGVISAYATWTALMAAKATWLAVQETVSAPVDEIVG